MDQTYLDQLTELESWTPTERLHYFMDEVFRLFQLAHDSLPAEELRRFGSLLASYGHAVPDEHF